VHAILAPVDERDRRPGLGQAPCAGEPEALRRAGDEGRLAA
jgi:hypothetical protein